MTHRLTETLIQRQINHWNGLRRFLHGHETADGPPPPGPVITISRQAGAGGRALARELCRRLDLTLHDRSLVEGVVRDRGLDPDLVAQLDEQDIRQSDLWVRGVLEQRLFMKGQYRAALVAAVEQAATEGGALFLGRGAHLILGPRADLRLRLVGSVAARQDRLREGTTLSRAEARTIVAETDRRRTEFVHKLFGTDAELAHQYDLVLNTDRLTPGACVEIALLALLERRRPAAAQPAQTAHA